jgi:hypothetical protein
VRQPLQRALLVALVDLFAKRAQRAACELRVVEANRARWRVSGRSGVVGANVSVYVAVEERVEEVDREVPAQRREVEVELVADRKVELGLERVEDQVDLRRGDRSPTITLSG